MNHSVIKLLQFITVWLSVQFWGKDDVYFVVGEEIKLMSLDVYVRVVADKTAGLYKYIPVSDGGRGKTAERGLGDERERRMKRGR